MSGVQFISAFWMVMFPICLALTFMTLDDPKNHKLWFSLWKQFRMIRTIFRERLSLDALFLIRNDLETRFKCSSNGTQIEWTDLEYINFTMCTSKYIWGNQKMQKSRIYLNIMNSQSCNFPNFDYSLSLFIFGKQTVSNRRFNKETAALFRKHIFKGPRFARTKGRSSTETSEDQIVWFRVSE